MMRIQKVLIDLGTEKHIHEKHGVHREEVEAVLVDPSTVFYRCRNERYMALGHYHRNLTIVFRCQSHTASVITAYPSSEWQIRLRRRK